MQAPLPFTRDLVMLGGGHAHALVLKMWGMNPLPGARVTLIDPHPTAPYTGMLPGYVAGHYRRDELDIDLVRLCRSSGARLTLASANGVDLVNRQVILDRQAPINFDILSINVGITSNIPDIPGLSAHAVPAKPMGRFADRWDTFCANLAAETRKPDIVIIGGGVGGVELAMAAAHRVNSVTGKVARITVVERSSAPLLELAPGARNSLLRKSASLGIRFKCSAEVASVESRCLNLASGECIEADFIVSASGAKPPTWFCGTGLDLEHGYIKVDEFLRSTNFPEVHGAGDCVHMSRAPRSKAGVFAVRAAPALFRNLRAALSDARPRPFVPQRKFLKLISTGGKHAIGEKWGIAVGGKWVWRTKDWIDRRFMAKFVNLPVMGQLALPAETAAGLKEFIGENGKLCGGCGSKVGRTALHAGLAGMKMDQHLHVTTGIGDDAAVLEWENASQVIATDHLRAFIDDPWLFSRIAAIHSLGDVWSMGARPQAALASIVLPRMSEKMLAETQREIMDAAQKVFGGEGAAIVGGHTSQGAELLIGFTVTGIPRDRPITKSGAEPGDRLILTRPIGAGTILAGEMAGRARGRDFAAALNSMSRSSGSAAKVLAKSATAMTDVTGFGLAGHLFEILEASGVAADIRIDAIPVLSGAVDLANAGVRSSIWTSNARLMSSMTNACGTMTDLLFDPQTAGGLLASVPQTASEDALEGLRRVGESPAIIGEVHKGHPWIAVS
ncbi:MAG: selenide, water dikinase SelD [Rhodobacteraceae bacterium]|nr:selenide, water dikinase SelD [Paracoccaceae bacterium]